jgi:hypothetical protein
VSSCRPCRAMNTRLGSLINNDLARDGCRRRTTKNALSWGERDLEDGLGFLRVNVMLSRVLQGSVVSSLPWSWLLEASGLSPMCGPAGRLSAACVA